MTRFSIEKISLVGEWNFDIINEYCSICKNSIFEPYTTSGEFDEKMSVPVMGKCNHTFHFYCINLWINNRNVCPLCNKDWKFKKIKKIN